MSKFQIWGWLQGAHQTVQRLGEEQLLEDVELW